jgi:hypothetical protein
MSAVLSAFGGEADIRGSRCLLWSDANDPKRTSTWRQARRNGPPLVEARMPAAAASIQNDSGSSIGLAGPSVAG